MSNSKSSLQEVTREANLLPKDYSLFLIGILKNFDPTVFFSGHGGGLRDDVSSITGIN